MSKKVVAVTPVHNRRDLTLQFLRSLSRADRTNLEIHTIVVDDGSTDGTSAAIEENFPEVEIVKGDGNLWYTAGMNRGIEAALKHKPDYILGVNDDSIFEEKCLRRMIECAEKHPKSVVGALLLLWDKPHQLFQTSPKWETLGGGWRHWHRQTVWTIPNKPWEVEIIVGNCVLYPTEAIRQVGFMDEKRFKQYGDAEYTPRMRKHGWRLLMEPKARVFCQPNDDPSQLRKMPKLKMLKILFTNSPNGHSLHRWFYVNFFGAPNKLAGLIAFFIFLKNFVFGKRKDAGFEKKLSEIFADKIVRE